MLRIFFSRKYEKKKGITYQTFAYAVSEKNRMRKKPTAKPMIKALTFRAVVCVWAGGRSNKARSRQRKNSKNKECDV